MTATNGSTSPTAGNGVSFTCPNCSADLTYDAAVQALRCGHCGQAQPVAQAAESRVVVEYDLHRALAGAKPHGLGLELRTSRCAECGATVSFPDQLTSTTCEFCGSAQVLAQESNRNLIRPESLVPCVIDQERARQLFRQWLGRLWLRPSNLKKKARVTGLSGVYVPYWTFDTVVESHWSAEAGHYYYETESYSEKGPQGQVVQKTRQVRRVRWEPARGARRDTYDDLLVCASKGLPADLVKRLRSFDTSALRPYEPAFLAGWKAEEYGLELNEAWRQAVQRVEATQHQRCAGDIPGDTHRFLSVTNRLSDETFKHVLLPLWIACFRYGDRVFRFLVNGQTGEVVGQAPWSIFKILLLVLICLVGVGLLGLVIAQQP